MSAGSSTEASKPTVRVFYDRSTVTEGENAVLAVRSDPAPSSSLEVHLVISQTGDFVRGATGARTVTITRADSDVPKQFTVPTTGDDAAEEHGAVTATLVASDRYDVGSPDTVSVRVLDNDSGDGQGDSTGSRGSQELVGDGDLGASTGASSGDT